MAGNSKVLQILSANITIIVFVIYSAADVTLLTQAKNKQMTKKVFYHRTTFPTPFLLFFLILI